MAMKVDLSILIIPLRIQQNILCVEKLLNLLRVESLPVRNGLPSELVFNEIDYLSNPRMYDSPTHH